MKATIGTMLLILLPLVSTETEWIADPSTGIRGEGYRVLSDFNADGLQDMALSCETHLFGKAGGQFTLYLANGNGEYREHGKFFAHPKAIALERIEVNAKVRVWTYVRMGGWMGEIGYHEVEKDGLSQRHSMTIHPGSAGTRIGNAIYEAVITNSDPPVRVERSRVEDGIVKWISESS